MISYRTALSPWAIYRWTGSTSSTCIARFRKRGDAEEHLKILRQQIPASRMTIVFDLPKSAYDRTGD